MSSSSNVSTGTTQRQIPEWSSSKSSYSAGRQLWGFERNKLESTPPLRLPQIQVPPNFETLRREKKPAPLSTCPSLHQHHRKKHDAPSTESLLRKFFAKQDNASELINDARPHGDPASSLETPLDKTSPHEVIPRGCQASQLGTHLHQFSPSHSHQSFQSNGPHRRADGQTSLAFNSDTQILSSSASDSNNTSAQTQENAGSWENSRPPGSPVPPNPSRLESSASVGGFEEVDSTQKELYRCSDCNRKCKSKASYLKHRSMMCTHRLGPLTLECRFCKRHYTYAGYLQRHEVECSKSNHP